jgi:glycosyltransferase involved in cell wall biosynthesis
MSKVTAIISAYFAEEYLKGRIENLLAQDPRPEVIVVCAFQSQEAEIVQTVIGSGREIAVVFTIGIPTIYEAWNLAIEIATGDYITNANSDDRLYPGALKILSRALDENPEIAIAYGDDDIVNEIGGDPVNRHQWIEGDLDVLRQVCFLGPMPMWRKSLHDKYGVFDEAMKSSGDYEFWLRMASRGERMKHIPRAIGAYLKRKDSVERRESLRTIWETARARSRYTLNM